MKRFFFQVEFSSDRSNERTILCRLDASNDEHAPASPVQLTSPQSGRVQRRHFAILILIFLLSILSLCTVYVLFPEVNP